MLRGRSKFPGHLRDTVNGFGEVSAMWNQFAKDGYIHKWRELRFQGSGADPAEHYLSVFPFSSYITKQFGIILVIHQIRIIFNIEICIKYGAACQLDHSL
jgi:hypothetical protein